jgi:hypothetical protein
MPEQQTLLLEHLHSIGALEGGQRHTVGTKKAATGIIQRNLPEWGV